MSSASEAPVIGLTHGGSEDTGLGQRGPASKSIVVPYGFWLFVLSDMVLFSALFATYASLVHATDGALPILGADAAVAHDVEFAAARLAATKAVRDVGQSILVQAAGGDHGCNKGKCRRWSHGKAESFRRGKDDGADQADDEAGDRRGPNRGGEAAAAKVEVGQGQTGEEDQAKRDIVEDLPGRKGQIRELHALALAIAWKKVPLT